MQYGIPEQSKSLMESLSSGMAFYEDSFLFISSDNLPTQSNENNQAFTQEKRSDWLMCIGYPCEGTFTQERFLNALNTVKAKYHPQSIFAIAPQIPEALEKHIVDRDVFYNLDISKPLMAPLRRVLKKTKEAIAQGDLILDITKHFTKAHRDLWIEFVGRSPMPSRVRSLYANIPLAIEMQSDEIQSEEQKCDLRLFNAWDKSGNLSACLVMDFSQNNAVSYILGAHSRVHYIPHASDALMQLTIDIAKSENKECIYLGLGVNEGITRFKKKWGATIGEPYHLAIWDVEIEESLKESITNLMQSFLAPSSQKVAKAKYINELPKQRTFAMLWEIEKKGKISWIGGTAHFFCYSFENSFRELFEKVDTVLFEGPLDPESFNLVATHGQNPSPNQKRVIEVFNEKEIQSLERYLYGYFNNQLNKQSSKQSNVSSTKNSHLLRTLGNQIYSKIFGTSHENLPDIRHTLANCAPWYAFFTLWSAWLKKQGWEDSVDMEAYYIALEMGKNVFGMEDIQEQIISLESAPYERITRFLKDHANWHDYRKKNIKAYLGGNLLGMPGTSAEFPTVAERVIGPRDERFRQRMRPFIEAGKTFVFVGSAHMHNLRYMLAQDGFNVRRILPTLGHKFRNFIHNDPELFLPASTNPAPHTKGEYVRTLLSEESQNIYLQTRSPKNYFTAEALVPEQLEHYVKSVSHSKALVMDDNFIAWKQESALILIAFPTITQADFDNERNSQNQFFEPQVLERALVKCIRLFLQAKLTQLIVLSPCFIEQNNYTKLFSKAPQWSQEQHKLYEEAWYFMDLPFTPRQKLRNMFTRAEKDIKIEQECFSPEHQELIETYIKTRPLKEGTRHIFRNIKKYCHSSPHVLLFTARDKDHKIQGFSIGDFSSPYTAFYMFAFRQTKSPPGTSDLLLNHIVLEAQKRGQTKVNLGLGISSGISLFKKKWNAYPLMPYVETVIQESEHI